MPKYFRRDNYQINMLSREIFNEWIEENPIYKGKIDYIKFRRYWKYFRNGFYEGVLGDTSGVDLPYLLGNVSIKVMDVDFRGIKDYAKSVRNFGNGNELLIRTSIDNTKRGKITWKKHRNMGRVEVYLGMECCKLFKTTVGKHLRTKIHFYEKMAKKPPITSKYEEVETLSLYDMA